LFRRRTNKDDIVIPEPISSTDFLEFTNTEKAIYDSAARTKDSKRMLQVCTNIMINEDISGIMGGRALSLSDVNSTMMNHYVVTEAKLTNNLELCIHTQMTTKGDMDDRIR